MQGFFLKNNKKGGFPDHRKEKKYFITVQDVNTKCIFPNVIKGKAGGKKSTFSRFRP